MALFSYFDNRLGWGSEFEPASDPTCRTGMLIQKLIHLALDFSEYLGGVNVPLRVRVEDVQEGQVSASSFREGDPVLNGVHGCSREVGRHEEMHGFRPA